MPLRHLLPVVCAQVRGWGCGLRWDAGRWREVSAEETVKGGGHSQSRRKDWGT